MSEAAQVQWFPGHMAKTRRIMQANLKLVDVVVELTDARIPYSSRNPEMDKLIGNKPRIILLNKADAADETVTSQWIDHYKRKGIKAAATDCRSGKSLNKFTLALNEITADMRKSWNDKGMTGRKVRIMTAGIPNVGKSSFINRIAGAKRVKVEDRPGVTRGKQWVTLADGTELLDMPGVLWPKFEDKEVGEKLAFTGAVKDDILDTEYLACRFLEFMEKGYPQNLVQRYGISLDQLPENTEESVGCVRGYEILERIGKKRGFLISRGETDTLRAAAAVLDEFRGGKLGRISLERPT